MSNWVKAVQALAVGPRSGLGTTSDLSIDETLLLHSTGWEPADLVFGVGWWSIPWGTWQYGLGSQGGPTEVPEATQAFHGAYEEACQDLQGECTRVGGTGVVGVRVHLAVAGRHISVTLSGTAIRRPRASGGPAPFLSDLSARDFALLDRAGWIPLGLAAGASFVLAPRRTAGQWLAQQSQNVELTSLTAALYHAREGAMRRMQEAARSLSAAGVVNVRLEEGPLAARSHVVRFVALGTAVELGAGGHRLLAPGMAVSLNDAVVQFDAGSLRSGSGS